jgi:hypothetical protein
LSNLRQEWDNFPSHQKLTHLYDWCENLTTAIESLRKENRLLRVRLGQAEQLAQDASEAAAEATAKAKSDTA